MNARQALIYALLVVAGYLGGFLTKDYVSGLGGRPHVTVLGAVHKPGTYTLSKGANVSDAIREAGGVTDEADLNSVDYAKPVSNGEKVYVATKDSGSASSVDALLNESQSKSRKSAAPAGVVNINTADLAELDTLPGVGPTIAQRIIDYRTANGKFRTIEEIKNVKGIGDKTFEKLKPYITVG